MKENYLHTNGSKDTDRYLASSLRPLTRRGFIIGTGAMGALGILGTLGITGCSPETGTDSETGDTVAGTYDVVIVGTGGAGMSAAISAYDNGATSICLLEKMGVNGGNTNYSSSGMNASETRFQQEQGIEDSNELFADETFEGGYMTADRELVDFMCDNSADAIDWIDDLGMTLDNIVLTGGMSVRRCHRPTDGSAIGLTLVPGLLDAVNDRGIPVNLNTEVTSLMLDDEGAVIGVRAMQRNSAVVYNARAVILATGGLGANQEMVTQYRPELSGYVTTNQPGATGDGYVMAEEAGAELIQMDQIQIHPTVEQSTSTLIAEGIRGSGAILINDEGRRFFDEMATRDMVSAAILEQTDEFAWVVFDQNVYDANTAIAGYQENDLVVEGANVSELAEEIGVDPATLQETIESYNAAIAAGSPDELGRTQGLEELAIDGNMYAIRVAPGIHHEMGGIRINTRNEALTAQGTPVRGLYAAGEVTGGIHGSNRIGGNAVCDIMVFGKNVGEVVAASL